MVYSERRKLVKENIFLFRPEWFSAYGLDKEKNFLQSPVCECECGCGGKCVILLDDFDALTGFAVNVLMENDCDHCAIFTHGIDDKLYAFVKMLDEDDEIVISYIMCDEGADFGFFKSIDDEFEFHCYGLLIETQIGQWKIIEN
jgi:hypothetical protein